MNEKMIQILRSRFFAEAKKAAAEGGVEDSVFCVMEAIKDAGFRCKKKVSHRSLFLGGYARVGKSQLAQVLCDEYGYMHLEADVLRQFFWALEDNERRRQIRKKMYKEIAESYPSGIVLEGDDFISENRHPKKPLTPFSIELLAELTRQYSLVGAIVGNSVCSSTEKYRALIEWRNKGNCWTSERISSSTLLGFAEQTILASIDLKEKAIRSNIAYLEIDPISFHKDIRNASKTIGEGFAFSVLD
ncbi:MAG: hypothetical protein EA401_14275 [Planctomycetota bacterium]|nr:MAG: hypothetical protein EA401_14275 [Planctomycetota bacterium]